MKRSQSVGIPVMYDIVRVCILLNILTIKQNQFYLLKAPYV